MIADQQTERPQSQVFTCIDCDVPHDAENLFVLPMNELARIKGEDDGPENAFITPEDLPEFAHCLKCREQEEIYTLASAIASSQRYHQRRITVVEAKEFVSCFSCEELGKKTMIPRYEAKSPGWVGCNLVKGRRLQLANLQKPNQRPLVYVTSEDLLKEGKEGFVLCPKCMEVAIPVLQKKARELGLSEDTISARIRPQSLFAMIKSVRRKEERESKSS